MDGWCNKFLAFLECAFVTAGLLFCMTALGWCIHVIVGLGLLLVCWGLYITGYYDCTDYILYIPFFSTFIGVLGATTTILVMFIIKFKGLKE